MAAVLEQSRASRPSAHAGCALHTFNLRGLVRIGGLSLLGLVFAIPFMVSVFLGGSWSTIGVPPPACSVTAATIREGPRRAARAP
jgi:hypothetical protein